MKQMLSNNIIRLRAPEPYDNELFAKWENDTTIWDTGSTCAPYSIHQINEYIANYDPDIFVTRQLRLMIELVSTGETVGAIDLYDFDPVNKRVGVGFIIDAAHRGNGYTVEALQLLSQYCRHRLGVKQMYAVVGVDNRGSIMSLEQARFKRCGKLRRWICTGFNHFTDAFIFQIVF